MTVLELHTQYFQGRTPTLNELEFETLVSLFPGLLVALADDEFQEEEKTLLNTIATEVVDEIASETLTEIEKKDLLNNFLGELNYLATNSLLWEDNFLYTLSIYIEIKPEFGPFISEMMYEIAKSTDGINDKELAKIYEVKTKLGIS